MSEKNYPDMDSISLNETKEESTSDNTDINAPPLMPETSDLEELAKAAEASLNGDIQPETSKPIEIKTATNEPTEQTQSNISLLEEEKNLVAPPIESIVFKPDTQAIPSNVTYTTSEVVSGKKSNVLILAIIGIIAVILVGLGIIFFVPSVKNSVLLTILSPEKYYQMVEKDYISGISKTLGEGFDKQKLLAAADTSPELNMSGDFKFTLGDDLTSIINLIGLDSLDGKFSATSKDKMYNVSMDFGINGSSIIKLNEIIDGINDKIFLQIPEFSDAYIGGTFEDLMEEVNGSSMEEISDAKLLTYLKTGSMTGKQLEELINRYAKIIYSNGTTTTIAKNSPINITGTAYENNVISIVFSPEDQKKMITELKEEMKKDEVLKTFLIEIEAFETEAEIMSELDSQIDDINSDVVSYTEMTMTGYIGSKGEFLGRAFQMNVQDEIGYYAVSTDDTSDAALWFNDSGAKIKIDIDSTNQNKDGVGKITYERIQTDYVAEPDIINIKFNNMEVVNTIKKYMNGNIELTSPSMPIRFEVKLDATETSQKCYIGALSEEMELFGIEVNVTDNQEAVETITAPTENVFDFKDDGFTKYANSVAEDKINAFSKKIEEILSPILDGLNPGVTPPEEPPVVPQKEFPIDNVDLTMTTVKLNNEVLGFPTTSEWFKDNVDFSQTVTAGDSTALFDNDTFDLRVFVKNYSSEDKPAKDCDVTGISCGNIANEKYKLTVNGVGIGSHLDDIIMVLGSGNDIGMEDDQNGIYYYYDTKSEIWVEFIIKNDIAEGITYMIMD